MTSGVVAPLLVGTAFAMSVVLTEALRRACLRWRLLDRPTADRWHRVPTPRFGGAAILAALTVSLLVFGTHPIPRAMVALLAGAAFTFIWGFIDDLRPLPKNIKLGLIVATGTIPLAFGLRFPAPDARVGAILAALWTLGVTNAVNWLDNMDGVAAGVGAAAAATLYVLSAVTGNPIGAQAALAIVGAAVGFLVLNFPPAKIFMGDSGSGVLGYALAVTALVVADRIAPTFPVPIFVCALALGIPILDMLFVTWSRTRRRCSILMGGRDHLAHRLALCGLTERTVACGLVGLTLLCGGLAVAASRAPGFAGFAAIGLGATPLVALGLLGSLVPVGGEPSPGWPIRDKIRLPGAAAVWQAALIGATLTVLYIPALRDLVHVWLVDDEYSHGPLIVAISAYLVWRQRHTLAHMSTSPSVYGYPVILVGLVMLVVGRAALFGYLMWTSLLVVLAGVVLFCAGARTLKVLAFPFCYLLFMIPLPYVVFDRIAFPLQHLAASVGAGVLDVIGIPVLLMGNIIGLPAAQLGVTEACSGIRSLMSLGAIGTIYAYFTAVGWGRVLVVLSVIPIAVATNVARIALTGVLTEAFGVHVAMGFYHTFSGLMLFAAGAALLVFARATFSTLLGPADWRRAHAEHA